MLVHETHLYLCRDPREPSLVNFLDSVLESFSGILKHVRNIWIRNIHRTIKKKHLNCLRIDSFLYEIVYFSNIVKLQQDWKNQDSFYPGLTLLDSFVQPEGGYIMRMWFDFLGTSWNLYNI